VASEAILKRLRELGVDYGQGYHLSKPRPLVDSGAVHLMPR
jgi:Amt family ammonium transporter